MALDLLRDFLSPDFLLLEVDRDGEVRDLAAGKRGAATGVDERLDVTGAEDHLVIDGDVLEERQQIDFLLILRADRSW